MGIKIRGTIGIRRRHVQSPNWSQACDSVKFCIEGVRPQNLHFIVEATLPHYRRMVVSFALQLSSTCPIRPSVVSYVVVQRKYVLVKLSRARPQLSLLHSHLECVFHRGVQGGGKVELSRFQGDLPHTAYAQETGSARLDTTNIHHSYQFVPNRCVFVASLHSVTEFAFLACSQMSSLNPYPWKS